MLDINLDCSSRPKFEPVSRSADYSTGSATPVVRTPSGSSWSEPGDKSPVITRTLGTSHLLRPCGATVRLGTSVRSAKAHECHDGMSVTESKNRFPLSCSKDGGR